MGGAYGPGSAGVVRLRCAKWRDTVCAAGWPRRDRRCDQSTREAAAFPWVGARKRSPHPWESFLRQLPCLSSAAPPASIGSTWQSGSEGVRGALPVPQVESYEQQTMLMWLDALWSCFLEDTEVGDVQRLYG